MLQVLRVSGFGIIGRMKKTINRHQHWLVFAADAAAVTVSYWVAFQLRFDLNLPEIQASNLLNTLAIVVVIRLVSFYSFNLYRGIWRYASIDDLASVFKAVLASQAVIAAVILFINHSNFPRAVIIIDPILTIVLVGGIRFAIRVTRELRHSGNTRELTKVLIFGAGDLGESLLREIRRDKTHRYKVAGFIDDNPDMWNHQIHGTKIFGGRGVLPKIISKYAIDSVVVAVSHSRGKLIGELMDLCHNSQILKKVHFKTVPTLSESLAKTPGAKTAKGLRNVELSDLLNRRPVQTDMKEVSRLVAGKTVLVTGAGGTIGSELCRQIAAFGAKCLLLLENHNTALFYIDKELSEAGYGAEIIPISGDVKDRGLLNNLFRAYKPELVFHAAAHKHVPLMEANPQEAVKNNALATFVLAETAAAHGVERFLYISTDKAVRPSSVMGATKRLGEMVLTGLAASSATKFIAVRFGNVLGSSGSAFNIFREQIAAGGPVTVTHPEITRYFMTTQEAIQLILQACSMGCGGGIFVLNMGEPVKVLQMVRNLIMLGGLEPEKDIAIKFTGLRPGEKMYEELFRPEDVRKDTGHPDIFMAIPEGANAAISKDQVMELGNLCDLPDKTPLLLKIRDIVPAFKRTPADKKASAANGDNA